MLMILIEKVKIAMLLIQRSKMPVVPGILVCPLLVGGWASVKIPKYTQVTVGSMSWDIFKVSLNKRHPQQFHVLGS